MNFASFFIITLLSLNISLYAESPRVSLYKNDGYYFIESNGLPQVYGRFPNRGNPNRISAQKYKFKFPIMPQLSGETMPLTRGMAFGITLTGIPFDPATAEYWNNDRNSGWRYEALTDFIDVGIDEYNAHVQPNGAYHYHGIPKQLVEQDASGFSKLIGFAADGFPIYAVYGTDGEVMKSSYQVKSGTRSSGPKGEYDGRFVQDYEYIENLGNLDECNGIFVKTPDYPQGIYAYFLTKQYPYIPRCFKGTPDSSFRIHGRMRNTSAK